MWADMTKLIVAFSNLAKEPTMYDLFLSTPEPYRVSNGTVAVVLSLVACCR